MSTIEDYRHAMDLVEKVERGPVSEFSAETRCFADLVRAVDNYHQETRKRADKMQAELTTAKGKLAGTPKKLRFGDGKQGWTLDFRQVLQVTELAKQREDVSMEDSEAVMLAMVDAGFAYMKINEQP